MVLPVVNAFALDAVPLKVPVIVPVEKPPLPSRLTIVFDVFDDVAEFTDEAIVVILAVFAVMEFVLLVMLNVFAVILAVFAVIGLPLLGEPQQPAVPYLSAEYALSSTN